MDIDTISRPAGSAPIDASAQPDNDRLNAVVAITVALLATFLGVCKVKDDNIVQAMQKAQVDRLNSWNYYQARNVRQSVAESTAAQLRLQKLSVPADKQADYDATIARLETAAAEQDTKKAELKRQAEAAEEKYDELNGRDDQFDVSDALLAIAIALLAVASLTQLWWLYLLALVPSVGGVAMGLAGLLGWDIQAGILVRWLS